MSKLRYERGAPIETFEQFDGQELVYVRNKIYHRSWVQNWQYRAISFLLHNRAIYFADKLNDSEPVSEDDVQALFTI